MKIIDKTSAVVSFESLKVGEVFKYEDRIYAKIETTTLLCQSVKNTRNAIYLTDLNFVTFSASTLVAPCTATLIVETKENADENKRIT